MFRQKIAVAVLTMAVFTSPAVGIGQDSSQNSAKKPSLLGQLDQFGKKLFGGLIPNKSSDDSAGESENTASPGNGRFSRGAMQQSFPTGRAGSVLDDAQKSTPLGKTIKVAKKSSDFNAENTNEALPAKRWAEAKQTAAIRRSGADKQPLARESSAEIRPLHERLMELSKSPYNAETEPKGVKENSPPRAEANKDFAAALGKAVAKPTPTPAPAPKRQPAVNARTNNNTAVPAGPTEPAKPSKPTLAKKTEAAKPALAKRPQSIKGGSGNVLIEADAAVNRRANVLFERQSPMLSVRTMGPRQIIVDKESIYTVFIDNLGKVPADDVVVAIELPEWADILGTKPSQGVARVLRAENEHRQLGWRVGALAAGGSEQIDLRIVPRQSRSIDLGVSWTFKPAVSQTVIEVREPKLELNLIGPREVAFGRNRKYQLEVANTGNGPAEDVAITLMPVAAGAGLPNTHRLGAFPAGKKISLEIALTPRQKDGLAIRVELHNEGKLCARLNEKILVRKAELEMIADGPPMQYVGTVAAYRIRLRNTGNAAAKNVKVEAKIPPQAKYLAADNGGKMLAAENKAVWSLPAIPPGSEKILELECELVQAGFNRIDVATTADDQIQVSTAAGTSVEAMADLTLEVLDPNGPVPVGKEIVYQIRICNRGSKRAEGVEAVAYFSQGIEPVSADGATHKIGPGQVLFSRFDAIEAGKQVLLKVTARADTPGNHMFRAEVHCKPLGTKLVGEETTHFFNGTLVAERPAVKQQTANRPRTTWEDAPQASFLDESRTADRRRNFWGDAAAPAKPIDESSEDQQSPTLAPRYRSQLR